jgi:hypothetical protein
VPPPEQFSTAADMCPVRAPGREPQHGSIACRRGSHSAAGQPQLPHRMGRLGSWRAVVAAGSAGTASTESPRDTCQRQPSHRTQSSPRDACVVLNLSDIAAAHPTNKVLALDAVVKARLRRGALTDRLALKTHDGSRHKLLWLKVDPAHEVLGRHSKSLWADVSKGTDPTGALNCRFVWHRWSSLVTAWSSSLTPISSTSVLRQ